MPNRIGWAAKHDPLTIAIGVMAAVIGLGAAAVWLQIAYMVLRSRLATGANTDPHGYVLIFGPFMAVPFAVVAMVALPFAVPRRYRAATAVGTTVAMYLGTALLFVALFTS
ncbi:hypothetical protein ACFVMC_30925 [Nocardia sp. NPDC127579]|uniref:hypothetical protein n=1 Tax=Nocardia sp. NPDC127579 TaxID=3345402 RepID=UPI0036453317